MLCELFMCDCMLTGALELLHKFQELSAHSWEVYAAVSPTMRPGTPDNPNKTKEILSSELSRNPIFYTNQKLLIKALGLGAAAAAGSGALASSCCGLFFKALGLGAAAGV